MSWWASVLSFLVPTHLNTFLCGARENKNVSPLPKYVVFCFRSIQLHEQNAPNVFLF